MIADLYIKPVLNTAAEEIRRIKEHYEKALDDTSVDEDNRRQYTEILQRKGYLVVKIVSTFKIQEREG